MTQTTQADLRVGDLAEIVSGELAGLVGTVTRRLVPAQDGHAGRVRLTLQGGRRVTASLGDVERIAVAPSASGD